jgi:glutamyl-tRNA synthetase
MTIITRFAPSPTGMLHIGNARTALITWLYARARGGKFILRIDDTDLARSTKEYEEGIKNDLSWLGLTWDETFNQSSRTDKYEAAKEYLIKVGRLYPCYETQEELEVKRKLQLSAHKPPIYDRSGLHLSEEQKEKYQKQGRKPHYRFLVEDVPIRWNDMVKGEIHYEGHHIGDPILIREDGSMTYILCSAIDDGEYNVSHIIRGEDHVTNTAVQIQIFEALGLTLPAFGHLSLVKSRDAKISKREGGYDIASLRGEEGLESMAINSFFARIGTSEPVVAAKNLEELVQNFDITTFSKSPTTYLPEELERINHKLIISLEYNEVKDKLGEDIDEAFWLAVRPNLKKLHEAKDWWQICHKPVLPQDLDRSYLQEAAELLPEGEIDTNTWGIWTKAIAAKTGKSGKELFMPLRLALTGMEQGPELKTLLPLIGRDEILKRMTNA